MPRIGFLGVFELVWFWYNIIMNTISRTVTGVVSIILGLYIIYNILLDKSVGWVWSLVLGIFFVVVGGYIFLNKKEDDIEKIKSRKN